MDTVKFLISSHDDYNACNRHFNVASIPTDSGLPTKPTQLSQQDLFYSYRKDETAVLTCNVQSTPPPAFRYY